MNPHEPASTLTIEQQYAAILAYCDDLLLIVRGAAPIGDVGRVRIRLATLLHANLSLEEASLIGPVRRLAVSERPARFSALGIEAAELRCHYSDHVGRWSLSQIADDRVAYTSAVNELVARVKAHVAKKQAVLPAWRQAMG